MKNQLLYSRTHLLSQCFLHLPRSEAFIARVMLTFLLGVFSALVFAQPTQRPGESIHCKPLPDNSEVRCVFTIGGASSINDVSIKMDQRPAKSSFAAYPAAGESTALLMLVDVSDAKRKKAVSAAATLIEQVLAEKQPHHSVAIAQFDSSLQLLSDFNADGSAQKEALKGIGPKGQATELYKSSLEAIAQLKKGHATRRVLVIFSDGKAEDKGYSHDDVIREALAAQVRIFTVGYPEAPSETPSLQTLERLAKDTNGQHRVAATADKSVPNDTVAQILSFAEHGGEVTFAHDGRIGQQSVVLVATLTDGESVSLSATISLPDTREMKKKVVDHLKAFAAFYAGGIGMLLALVAAFLLWLKRRRSRAPKLITHAVLEELSGQGTKHRLQKQASRIGRAADNDVCLRNNSVSSYHAEINVRRDGSLVLIDLGSSNGTYVNGKKIGSETVNFGALIELGEVRLRLQQPT